MELTLAVRVCACVCDMHEYLPMMIQTKRKKERMVSRQLPDLPAYLSRVYM